MSKAVIWSRWPLESTVERACERFGEAIGKKGSCQKVEGAIGM